MHACGAVDYYYYYCGKQAVSSSVDIDIDIGLFHTFGMAYLLSLKERKGPSKKVGYTSI